MKDLTKGNEAKLIFFFSLPMLIGNVFQQLYTTVDSIIVGKFIGKSALAAVGASFPVIFFMVALILGISMGSTVLIAQYFGARQMKKVQRTVETSLVFLFWASLVITVLGLMFSGPILRLIRIPDDVFPQARIYLNIIFSGMIFMFGYNAVSAILRGLGDSKTPLYYLIIANVVNIILDLLLVVVFKWGIKGSAWATVIAQACSFMIAFIHLRRKHEIFQFKLTEMVFDKKIFILAFQIGFPSAIQQVLVAVGMMALVTIVNGFGVTAMAGFTAASRIDSFAAMPAMNLSMALTTFTAQNLGAKMVHRVKKGFIATLVMSSLISAGITLFVVVFGWHLISVFTADQEVIRIGTRYLLIVGGFYILFSTMFVANGLLRGAGQTVIPMFSTILALWVIRIPLAALLSRNMGTDGIWLGIPIAWFFGLALSLGYYFTGRWKKTKALSHLEEEVLELNQGGAV
ncbi:MAG: MATE family efflux transporter [bacterium]|nr:MATE family efflux transporter [bacterium]